jgi:hypothetical protein
MSEAIETAPPQDGGAPAPEPAATETPPPADTAADTGAETAAETTEEAAQRVSREEKRISVLTARLAQQAAKIEALERYQQAPPQQPDAWPQTPEELERLVDARAEAKAAQQALQARAEAFHEAGRAAHPEDWAKRCADLVAMGGDAHFSQLLLELPDGARVAAALADDPAEMSRIATIRTERGRAIELGKYAAKVADAPAAPPPPRRAVSRAPPPIQPVTGSANLAFDMYAETDASALAGRLMKENLEKRMRQR